jgi:hypothetical protein
MATATQNHDAKKNDMTPPPATSPHAHNVPEGYTEQSSDIVGFWTGEGAIHFIPRFVRIFDSKIDRMKASTLVVAELVEAAVVVDANKHEHLAAKGSRIGVWTKSGMAALKNLAGVPVYMYEDGEKDVGKPSPMRLFKIMSRGHGASLPIEADLRKFSKPEPKAAVQGSLADDNIPF